MTQSTIKIKDKEYKLKVTLGLYKKLSFPKSELSTIIDNAVRQFEVIKLALYYGNKQECNWQSLSDMDKELSDEVLEEIDDCNLIDKINEAIYINLPDSLKKVADENSQDLKKKVD